MLTGVDALTELDARLLKLLKRRVAVAEVVIGRDDVGLRELNRCFRAALALRIERHARRDRQPVMAADRDDRRVAHRDPAHMISRDGPFVVGQRVSRDAPNQAQRAVEAHDHARHRAIPQRQHDPVARPRKPRAEQARRASRDLRPVAVIPLQPAARLGHPRPRAAPVLNAPYPLRPSDRSSRRALRPQIAHQNELFVRLVRPDPALRQVNPLLDLLAVPLDPRTSANTRRQPAPSLITSPHPMRDRLVITARELRGAAQRARQIKRLKNLHNFLRSLQRQASSQVVS